MSSLHPHPRPRMNQDRFRLFKRAHRKIAFICECADPDCRQTVILTPSEYESRRPGLILHAEHAEATEAA